MAKQKPSMEEMFQTVPEIPEGFTEWCYSFLPKIAIYYRRKGKYAECRCGKCGREYIVEESPARHGKAHCPHCENIGFYEWKRITNESFFNGYMYLFQCTTDGNLVARYFGLHQNYSQYGKAVMELKELKRIFLTLGDVYYYNHEVHSGIGAWERIWEEGKGYESMKDGELYDDWRKEIAKSNLKYCDIDQIQKMVKRPKLNILITFANNPALEMYAKAGMEKLVNFLIRKEGKTKWINRRGKSLKAQLRLKDKRKIKRFMESKGDMTLLEILQMEEKTGKNYTVEQEQFLRKVFAGFYSERARVEYLLKFMSLQQLMNRVEKYKQEKSYYSDCEMVRKYYDYLSMREEMGYDMTNEVYLHPKNLTNKHDEMVGERRARQDELHIAGKLRQYPKITQRYKNLCRKYSYSDGTYVIRPARDAAEIIMEGRTLHHCVGGDNYLSKHNNGETTILFLRKCESANEPYYTIEIKGDHIIQWYGLRDKKPDEEMIGPWLERYVEWLKAGKKKEQVLLQAAG